MSRLTKQRIQWNEVLSSSQRRGFTIQTFALSTEHIWVDGYSVQFSSVTQLCPTLCNPMNHSTPGLPVHHQLPEFTQTLVHQVGDAIQPSHPLSSPSPPAPSPSQHQGLFQWVNSSHEVAQVLKFQLQHQSFQWTPRTDLLQDGMVGSPCSPRDSQESSPTPQFKSINSSALSFLHSPTVTSIHDHRKNHSLDGLGRAGNGTPLQYSCLENPMEWGAWWATVHGVAKSQTWLSDFTFTFHFHALEKEMATHSRVLAWRIPGTGEPGGLPFMGSHRVGHDWSDLAAAANGLGPLLAK